ncbi:hypothetical protein G7B40_039550 [Aetokthonos hydrillicola Thurmond2011]|jgi:hypothetical protein|uniref:Uncharacterized protein n=1 Tax=Aetokthonos hydrillicola Thurmond2011 TaxID=2712845 RepID=A0AAP5ME63_9CYAN|nr:hypothetical protein [Aetokthonos hydrillicola]MBO3461688.1 hypothetical protein [Aetokthonos hydrillicola CCALA 1050]MBW4590006.1 hypothetical protein [Aetokthonos hydrillicola CCALA 1050]MDR9900588.1 hypothetical protein [Aetokthonos hydrillicola Thurmond2011]
MRRLSLILSVVLTVLFCWNAPVVALPLAQTPVQQAQSLNFTKANTFELSGGSIVVSYSETSFSGVPLLSYRDNNFNLNFSGQQIRIQDTEIGQLITVTLETVPDLRTVTFTLVLPSVNLSTTSEKIRITVPGIKTTTLTTIAGPGRGAEKTYSTVNLKGTASFTVS